ncbi:hypothetical protein PO878_20300 [Iamia majanohamensis]|uniref:Uncharacterized protein n=1 Tax=Iamia majanohamensis TaxID=467976 RepID=A0AAE9YFG1_9ACTN|nr:hypothetical protein [Iamia majanohamensis]WCO66836.1 hypothetical protein PO878_20300 [Iamia majanohamensis]
MLLFIAISFALLVSLLGFTITGTKALHTYRVDRTLRYGTDAALEVAVQMVKANPAMAQSSPVTPSGTVPPCAVQLPLDEATVPGASQVMVSGSYLTVTCEPTSGVAASGGPDIDSTASVPTQAARDVTFVVTCGAPGTDRAQGDRYECMDGPDVQELGRARVRFDIDPGFATPSERAIVPKILTWTLYE